jgi:hypothetical protein
MAALLDMFIGIGARQDWISLKMEELLIRQTLATSRLYTYWSVTQATEFDMVGEIGIGEHSEVRIQER